MKRNIVGKTLFRKGFMSGVHVKMEEDRAYSDDLFYSYTDLIESCSTMIDLLIVYNDIIKSMENLKKLQVAMQNKIKMRLREMNRKDYFDDVHKLSVSLTIEKKETIDMKLLHGVLTKEQIEICKNVIEFEKFNFFNAERQKELRDKIKPMNIISRKEYEIV